MSTQVNSLKGIMFLVLSAFLYSLMPVLIRFLGSGGLPPMSQVFLRYIFAFLSAFLYFGISSKVKVKIRKLDIGFLAVATVFGYALTNLFFTYGILYTQVSNALFLFYSYAIITPVFGFLFLREKINKTNIGALALSFLALILLCQPTPIPTWKLGGFFAVVSAFGQTTYLVLRKKLKNYPADFMMLANTLVGVVVLGILSIAVENAFYTSGAIATLSLNTWLVTVLFGIINFLAWLTMTKGFEYFKATSGSLILLSELIFGIAFAFMFFREVPTLEAFAGGMLILASSVLVIFKGESA